MSLDAAEAKLHRAMHDLHLRWEATRLLWRDSVAEQFDQKVLNELEKDVRTTLAAMEHLRTIIDQVRNDCS
jgi:uncharacterized membrane protein YgaE (UPF0421/DUF939 family)